VLELVDDTGMVIEQDEGGVLATLGGSFWRLRWVRTRGANPRTKSIHGHREWQIEGPRSRRAKKRTHWPSGPSRRRKAPQGQRVDPKTPEDQEGVEVVGGTEKGGGQAIRRRCPSDSTSTGVEIRQESKVSP
jgi:hypothetical protein